MITEEDGMNIEEELIVQKKKDYLRGRISPDAIKEFSPKKQKRNHRRRVNYSGRRIFGSKDKSVQFLNNLAFFIKMVIFLFIYV